ncbi:Bucentaur [Aphelenchoides bicaudatus]|nr:Bucentaur [Aphelenchoides bicaudatus]
MPKVPENDEYHSSEDEDYEPPKDAPPENENDAYLINKEEATEAKASEPTKNIDDLWADFIKPTTSETSTTTTVSSSKSNTTAAGTKRKFEPPKKGSGFQSAISQLKKSKKTSVLEKSQKDWNKFVEEKSMKEELESHDKSKDSYLDQQDFIAKADYNKFVKERESREQARKPL